MPRSARARAVPGPDRGDGRPGERPGIEPRRLQRLEQQPHPVGAGEADQRVVADRLDGAAHLLGLDARLDPDRRQLDHLGAEAAQGRGEAACLGAGAGDDDAAAVQRPALQPGERLAALDHRADDDQRRGADALALDRGGDRAEGRGDGALSGHRAPLDRGGGLVGVAAGLDQRRGVLRPAA